MIYTREKFKKHITEIEIDDFKIKSGIQAYQFIRKEDVLTKVITISYRDYTPHGFYIDGVTVKIFFNNVETILENTYKSIKMKNRHGITGTIHQSLINLSGIDYTVFKTQIDDKKSFQVVAKQIKNIIKEGALPFFKQFNSLHKIFEYTESQSIEDMSNFIGQPLPQRRMIIKKLCGDEDYKDYVKKLCDYYKEKNNSDLLIIQEIDSFLRKN